MKKQDLRIDPELEKDIRKKMSELSSGVNCFDKISNRVFPEKDTDFEVTVSDVEIVSGRHKVPLSLKWGAAAAAVIACIAVIPRTAPFQEYLANVTNEKNNEFCSIVDEIRSETENNDYKVYDMALSDYSKYDIMYCPIGDCPFEYTDGDEETRVRLFVRVYGDTATNQMYAVEYSGEYKSSNFIAAAETDAKFTDAQLKNASYFDDYGSNAVWLNSLNNDFSVDRYGELTDENGDQFTVASYTYNIIFKNGDYVGKYAIPVKYCKNDNESVYHYDYLWRVGERINWKRSLYNDDTSAVPLASGSMFINDYSEITSDAENAADENDIDIYRYINNLAFYSPYLSRVITGPDDCLNTLEIKYLSFDRYFVAPADNECKTSMEIYIPYVNFMSYSSQSNPAIYIRIVENDISFEIHRADIFSTPVICIKYLDEDKRVSSIRLENPLDPSKIYFTQIGDDDMEIRYIGVD